MEEVVYAKCKDGTFVAGIDLEALTDSFKKFKSNEKVVLVNEGDIPLEYDGCIKRLKKPDWRVLGTFPLVKNLEKSGDLPRGYFREEKIE